MRGDGWDIEGVERRRTGRRGGLRREKVYEYGERGGAMMGK